MGIASGLLKGGKYAVEGIGKGISKLLGKSGAKMATETAEKSGAKVVASAEKKLTAGKIVKGTAKVAGTGIAAAGSLVGGTIKAGGKVAGGVASAASSVLGGSGGLSSLLKLGSVGAVLAMLTNKNVLKGIENVAKGLGGGLSQASSNVAKTNTSNTATSMAATTGATASLGTQRGTKADTLATTDTVNTGDMGHDKYAAKTIDNTQKVVANAQQTQQQATSSVTKDDGGLQA